VPKEYRKRLLPLNSACDFILAGMKDGQGNFLASLTKLIHQRFHVEIPLSAWPLDSLPEHLRLRFAIVDEKNREVVAGRDLLVLQDKTIEQIKSQAFEECRLIWERSQIKDWDFGELPVQVELRDSNGLAGLAYPALSTEAGLVHIKLFLRREEARRCHQEGVIALFALHRQETLKYLKKAMVLQEEAKRWARHLGGAKAIETALYRRTLFRLFDTEIRTAEGFHAHIDIIQGRILTAGQEALNTALPVLKIYYETAECLNSMEADNRGSRMVREFLNHSRQALHRIAPPDFMEHYSDERLRHLPRYLRALIIGAQRGMLHLEKAMLKVKEMQSLVEEMQNMIDTTAIGTSDKKRTLMDEYYWMVEEYRVSLFAQELKTLFPVSRKKLAEKMEEIVTNQ
jgi:ATP-dependent helicase HrpA